MSIKGDREINFVKCGGSLILWLLSSPVASHEVIDGAIDAWPGCESALIELDNTLYSDAVIYQRVAREMLLSQRYSKELTEKISHSMIESKRAQFQLSNVIREACAEDKLRSKSMED